MNDASEPQSSIGSGTAESALLRWAMRLLASVALIIAGYLTWAALTGDSVAGCGGGGWWDCSEVLRSKWSTWLGMPVGLPAGSVYATLLGALFFIGPGIPEKPRRLAWRVATVLVVIAATAAIWFIGIQVIVLDGVCFFCMAAHVCSLLLAGALFLANPLPARQQIVSVVIGTACIVPLVAVQLFAKRTKNYEIEAVDAPSDLDPVVVVEQPATEVKSRVISILNGRAELDVFANPIVGSPDADHVLVELFDYTCKNCREMHHQLSAARERYGGQIAISVLVVPLNADCNTFLRETPRHHRDACGLARMAIAVWRTDSEKFHEFHEWLMNSKETRSISESRRKAIELVGAPALQKELESWVVDEHIARHVEIFGVSGRGKIPKVLFRQIVLRGKVDTDEEFFELLEKELGVRPVSP